MLLLTAVVVRVYQQAAAARAPNQLRLLLLSAVVVLWMLAVRAIQHQRAGGSAARIRLLLLPAVVVLWMLAVPAFQHQRIQRRRLLLLLAVVVLWMLAILAFQHQRPSVPSQLQPEHFRQVSTSFACVHYLSHTHHFQLLQGPTRGQTQTKHTLPKCKTTPWPPARPTDLTPPAG